ncbi:hypothetical protein JCM8547_007247 [Rhodosporidiobolus lusitaniae]
MPKSSSGPLSALFAINKPTGQPSMTLLNKLQPLFSQSLLFKDPNAPQQDDGGRGKGGKRGKGRGRRGRDDKVKMGQGGTLDPLADGVLVVGTNAATKHLSRFLDCTKEYRAIGLLGCSTDSYDSEGKRVRDVPGAEKITREMVEGVLDRFRGEIEQTPPIYSALKMDGKALYDYARTNTPLPRPIPSRKVTVHSLELLRFEEGDKHEYNPPREKLEDGKRLEIEALEKMVKEGGTTVPNVEEVKRDEQKVGQLAEETAAGSESAAAEAAPSPLPRPPIFELTLTVSSGTYIRSIVHDIGLALGNAAHVVKLTRTRQGEFALNDVAPSSAPVAEGAAAPAEGEEKEEKQEVPAAENLGCVEWTLLQSAIAAQEKAKKEGKSLDDARDAEGWLEWEREVLRRCKEV